MFCQHLRQRKNENRTNFSSDRGLWLLGSKCNTSGTIPVNLNFQHFECYGEVIFQQIYQVFYLNVHTLTNSVDGSETRMADWAVRLEPNQQRVGWWQDGSWQRAPTVFPYQWISLQSAVTNLDRKIEEVEADVSKKHNLFHQFMSKDHTFSQILIYRFDPLLYR